MNKSKIKNILVISLSNIGDVILTLPVVDFLKQDFPDADMSLVVGPKAVSLFKDSAKLKGLFIYNKRSSLADKWQLVRTLFKQRFDLIVDLRNTAIPYMIWPRYRTSIFMSSQYDGHMRDKHLTRLGTVIPVESKDNIPLFSLDMNDAHHQKIDNLLAGHNVERSGFIVIAPGAANPDKRWPAEEFARLSDALIEQHSLQVVMVGGPDDRSIGDSINQNMKHCAINLCGDVSLIELACLVDRCLLAVVNDSGPMHLISYLNRPVLAIYLDSDPAKYGPWSSNCMFLDGRNPEGTGLSPQGIKAEDVLSWIKIQGNEVCFQK